MELKILRFQSLPWGIQIIHIPQIIQVFFIFFIICLLGG